jgi:hypothetical protein
MNQEILIRLEKQAEKLVLEIPASLDCDEYTALFNEKLTELILKECTDVLMQRHEESKHSHNYYHVTANMLKKHFEVKE